MKGSLIVIVFFCVGCIMGVFNKFQFDTHTVSMYILYALMLQVGISIGSNKNLKAIISHLHPKMLLIPLGTITGTLLFSALASILLSQWSVPSAINKRILLLLARSRSLLMIGRASL